MSSESTVSPLISVVIPTHNRAALLKEAIKSVLSQKVSSCEILVVDDRSTDETPQVVATYPVRYLRVESGKPSRTRNAGIRAATGKYVAFLDDDDIWLSEWLSEAILLLEADADLSMVYGQAQLSDATGNQRGAVFPSISPNTDHPVSLFFETTPHMNTLLVRRTVFDAVGLFDESLDGAEDKDLALRIARNARCRNLPRPVALVRIHQVRSALSPAEGFAKWQKRYQDELTVLSRHTRTQDSYRPDWKTRASMHLRHRGWYVPHFLNCSRQAITMQDKRTGRAAVVAAFHASPLHALKNLQFWKCLKAAL